MFALLVWDSCRLVNLIPRSDFLHAPTWPIWEHAGKYTLYYFSRLSFKSDFHYELYIHSSCKAWLLTEIVPGSFNERKQVVRKFSPLFISKDPGVIYTTRAWPPVSQPCIPFRSRHHSLGPRLRELKVCPQIWPSPDTGEAKFWARGAIPTTYCLPKYPASDCVLSLQKYPALLASAHPEEQWKVML